MLYCWQDTGLMVALTFSSPDKLFSRCPKQSALSQRRTRTRKVQVMSWSVDLGGRMTFAKFLLPFLILHSVCEGSNNPPRFLNYFFSTYLLIYEDMPIGSSVAQLKATDPEQEPLMYGVSGEEAMKYFSVNQDTGVVWLRQQLDRETKSEMQVEFYVSDIQEVVKDTVNIQIGDVNDNSPTFHGQPYTVHIPECVGPTSPSPPPPCLWRSPSLVPITEPVNSLLIRRETPFNRNNCPLHLLLGSLFCCVPNIELHGVIANGTQ
ncbi:unnamed protein product [Pleuronectes platessa]|uniref:Cadherin domain-containing protein n=1 Tax=Pleuronectes platessa TaxID=8262 RepID=A0A9N7YGV0_PLEPL|nr:unnamed protein product [Pleuronectes platessa]